MKSGVSDKSQPISYQYKQRASSGAVKPPSRFQPKSDKGQRLVECIFTNTPTEHKAERGKDFIGLKKKVRIEITQAQ